MHTRIALGNLADANLPEKIRYLLGPDVTDFGFLSNASGKQSRYQSEKCI
jgi:hypothetical protein